MEAFLQAAAHWVALVVEAVAIACVAIGAVEAIARGLALVARGSEATGMQRRDVWMGFARWLVAALTFQLGADIVGTSFSADWTEIGHLAAIAAIRTFLSFFLDREVDSTRELQRARAATARQAES